MQTVGVVVAVLLVDLAVLAVAIYFFAPAAGTGAHACGSATGGWFGRRRRSARLPWTPGL